MRNSRPFAAKLTMLTAALALVTPLLAGPARAELERGIVLSYEMWQGGFQPLNIEFRLANSPERYRAAFTAETSGVVGWAFPYRVQALSEGQAEADGPRPETFRSTMRKPDKERQRWINYGQDGQPEAGFDPPRRGNNKDEPRPEEMAGTIDPVSGLVAVIDRVQRGLGCAAVVPVYDGKRAYNLHVTERGQKKLKGGKYGLYSGKATVCRVKMEKVAGFREKKKRFGVQYLPKKLDIWFAPAVEGKGPVPVRMEGKTDLGNIVVHLVKIDRNPTTWEAMVPKPSSKSGRKTRDYDDSVGR